MRDHRALPGDRLGFPHLIRDPNQDTVEDVKGHAPI